MELINDFDTSVKKAFGEIDPAWESYDGLVICGTHNPKGVSKILDKIQLARETNRPFLGICMGMQLMVIEYARNVLQMKDATSEEFGKGTFVIVKMPELRVGIFPVGRRMESHWHNYMMNPEYLHLFKDYMSSHTGEVIEELGKDNMLGVQYHPEYQSSKEHPHPVLKLFLEQCQKYTSLIPRI